MSDTETLAQDELTTLKARAEMMGVTYHPSIGLEKLREKVNAAVTATGPATPEFAPPVVDGFLQMPGPAVAATVAETANQKRLRMKQECTALVRIRVTCMNPAKKEWDGEFFTTGNAVVGSMTKYMPFNAEEGWHVPNMIYQMIKDRMCPVFHTVVDERGNKVRKGKLIREFNIEVLPQLTREELDELARRQALSKSID